MSALSLIFGLLASFASANTTPYASLNFEFPSDHLEGSRPFHISVNETFIQETIQKVKLYRPSIALQQPQQPNWDDGPPPLSMIELADHWVHQYDWFRVQEEINNNFSHWTSTVPGSENYPHPLPLHFVHERAVNTSGTAIPLLMLHGWPSTHLEWSKVIQLLTHPSDSDSLAFHVVAPDLPGFGFSPAAEYAGLGPRELGVAFDTLMHQLGYSSYAVYSTDLGWEIAMWMVHGSSSITAHMTDFFWAIPNAMDLQRYAANQTSAEENAYIASLQAYQNENFGYAAIQSTRPLSLALGLTDSPVGFVGWVWQLLSTASDGYPYSLDDLITTSMVLWIQGTYGNLRSYKEFLKPGLMDFPRTSVPTGITQWAAPNGPYPNLADFALAPRDWIERTANVTFLSRHMTGGHFPALSEPELWLQDVQAFFSDFDFN